MRKKKRKRRGGECEASIIPDFEKFEQVDGFLRSSELPEQTPRNQAVLAIWKLLPQAQIPSHRILQDLRQCFLRVFSGLH